jgi:hypothetical protein
MCDSAQRLGFLSSIVKRRYESIVLRNSKTSTVLLRRLLPELNKLLRSSDIRCNRLLGQYVLSRGEGSLDVLRLAADGQGDDDSRDIVTGEEVLVGFALAAVGGVQVDAGRVFGDGGEVLGALEGTGEDGLEGEEVCLLNGGLDGIVSGCEQLCSKRVRPTRCSSLAKMPLPMIATPIGAIV